MEGKGGRRGETRRGTRDEKKEGEGTEQRACVKGVKVVCTLFFLFLLLLGGLKERYGDLQLPR
jgi:hypothetical protein